MDLLLTKIKISYQQCIRLFTVEAGEKTTDEKTY